MTLTAASRMAFLAAIAAAACALPAAADDARPTSDEQCVARCDEESDRCMARADTEAAAQKCDDEYAKCLEKCR